MDAIYTCICFQRGLCRLVCCVCVRIYVWVVCSLCTQENKHHGPLETYRRDSVWELYIIPLCPTEMRDVKHVAFNTQCSFRVRTTGRGPLTVGANAPDLCPVTRAWHGVDHMATRDHNDPLTRFSRDAGWSPGGCGVGLLASAYWRRPRPAPQLWHTI